MLNAVKASEYGTIIGYSDAFAALSMTNNYI